MHFPANTSLDISAPLLLWFLAPQRLVPVFLRVLCPSSQTKEAVALGSRLKVKQCMLPFTDKLSST